MDELFLYAAVVSGAFACGLLVARRLSYRPRKVTLVVGRREKDFIVYLEGDPGKAGFGENQTEALGDFFENYAHLVGVTVTLKSENSNLPKN